MGKKSNSKYVDEEERQREEDEDELEKELAALEQIRREREGAPKRGIKRKAQAPADEDEESEDEDEEDEEDSSEQPGYNRDAMLRCLADWETINLPFLETMKVDDFVINVQNELDDIEREVHTFAFPIYLANCFDRVLVSHIGCFL